MKKFLVFLTIVALLVAAMAMTRPDKKAHKEAMMKAVKEYVDDEARERGFGDNGLTRLGKNAVVQAVELALNYKLQLDDYYVVTVTHAELKGEDRILSVGVLGHVFTFDKEMLREQLEKQ